MVEGVGRTVVGNEGVGVLPGIEAIGIEASSELTGGIVVVANIQLGVVGVGAKAQVGEPPGFVLLIVDGSDIAVNLLAAALV